MAATLTRSSETDYAPRVFISQWGLAVAFHQFWLQLWVATPLDATLTSLALLTAFNPSSTRLFVLFAVTHISKIVVEMPYAWNHELLALIVELHFVVALILVARTKRGFSVQVAEVFAIFAPAARLSYATLYFFTTFHKLNSDFLFNPDVSCGSHFYRIFIENYPGLQVPSALSPEVAATVVTMGSEALIPILLVPRKTRPVGVVWAVTFHTLVGATNNTDFSTLAFALIVLFVSPAFLNACAQRVTSWLEAAQRFGPAAYLRSASLNVLFPLALVFALTPLLPITRRHYQTVQVAWLLCALGFLSIQVYGMTVRDSQRLQTIGTLRLQWWPQRALQVLLLFLGLSPYLGFRTEGSFSMFSNLRTEGGRSNHLLMPAVPLFNYQTDLVTLVDTNDRDLLIRTNFRTRRLVFFEFQKQIRKSLKNGPWVTVTYRRRGKLVGPIPVQEVVEHLRDYNAVENKVLWFRSVPHEGDKDYCQH